MQIALAPGVVVSVRYKAVSELLPNGMKEGEARGLLVLQGTLSVGCQAGADWASGAACPSAAGCSGCVSSCWTCLWVLYSDVSRHQPA